VRLGDVCKIQGGYAFKSKDFLKNHVPVIRIGNIQDRKVIIDENIGYTKEFLSKHPEFEVKYGDILIALSGATVGKIGKYQERKKALLNQRVGKFVVTDKMEERYLYLLLQSPLFESFILNNAFGCAQPNISNKKIEEFQFFHYEKTKQIEIADKLDRVQEIIDLKIKQIEELDKLIKSKFVEMFGDKGFIEKQIKEFADVKAGGTPDRNNKLYWEKGNIPWIKTGEVKENLIINAGECITELGLKNSSAVMFEVGTILIAMYGHTRGRCAKLGIQATTNQACAGISIYDDKIINDYLFYYLQIKYEELRNLGLGGVQPNLNSKMIKDFYVIIPPIKLQNQFACILQKANQQKQVLQTSLEQTQVLQQSLMNQYFE